MSISVLLTYIYRRRNTIALQSIASWYDINFLTTYKLKLMYVLQSISMFFLWFSLTFQSARYYKSLKIFYILVDKFEMYLWLHLPPYSSPPFSYYISLIDSVYSSSFVTHIKSLRRGFYLVTWRTISINLKEWGRLETHQRNLMSDYLSATPLKQIPVQQRQSSRILPNAEHWTWLRPLQLTVTGHMILSTNSLVIA